jgi:hypothetical protein
MRPRASSKPVWRHRWVAPRANSTTMPERHWGGIASYCQSVPPGEQERDHEGNEEPHDGFW